MGNSRYYIYPPDLENEKNLVGKSWTAHNIDLQPDDLVSLCLSSTLPELRALCLNFSSLRHLSEEQKKNLTSAAVAASAKYCSEIMNVEKNKLTGAVVVPVL